MAVPPPPTNDKTPLRRHLRAARRDFVAGLGAEALSDALAMIGARLAPLLEHDGSFAGYVAQTGEPDVLPFLLRAFHLGHTIALPHIAFPCEGGDPARGAGPGLPPALETMRFRRWHPDTTMVPGALGIPQPDAAEPVEPAILLTPLVGFDRAGNRLGQGGGYYDRWFAAHPGAMRIGVAWSVQEVSALVVEPWDRPLHAIVTEQEWIAPS